MTNDKIFSVAIFSSVMLFGLAGCSNDKTSEQYTVEFLLANDDIRTELLATCQADIAGGKASKNCENAVEASHLYHKKFNSVENKTRMKTEVVIGE